jgi:hypothetical protein
VLAIVTKAEIRRRQSIVHVTRHTFGSLPIQQGESLTYSITCYGWLGNHVAMSRKEKCTFFITDVLDEALRALKERDGIAKRKRSAVRCDVPDRERSARDCSHAIVTGQSREALWCCRNRQRRVQTVRGVFDNHARSSLDS